MTAIALTRKARNSLKNCILSLLAELKSLIAFGCVCIERVLLNRVQMHFPTTDWPRAGSRFDLTLLSRQVMSEHRYRHKETKACDEPTTPDATLCYRGVRTSTRRTCQAVVLNLNRVGILWTGHPDRCFSWTQPHLPRVECGNGGCWMC